MRGAQENPCGDPARREVMGRGTYASSRHSLPEVHVANLAKLCVGVAALALVVAVVTVFTGPILVGAEGWSRASTNVALLALCLFVGFKEGKA